jgi:hypothetical protein
MVYDVIPDQVFHKAWRAVATNAEGKRLVAVFTGPEAEQRARDYAFWINAAVDGPGTDRPHKTPTE